MTTMNTNTKTMNTTITVGNITMSANAYEEFYNLRMEVENSKVFRDWTCNPYFLIALYDYYKAGGNGMMMAKVKSIIKNRDWFFDGTNLYVYPSDEQYEVTVRQYNGKNFSDKVYTGEKGFEVIRDLCMPVVLNYN